MSKNVRLIYGDGESLSDMDHVRRAPRKVFAVIGPFDGHTDKPELQEMILAALREYLAQ